MIRLTWRLLRLIGLLLTPLVAVAAAALGAWIGAMVGRGIASPGAGIVLLVVGAAVGSVVGASLWMWEVPRFWRSTLRRRRARVAIARAKEISTPPADKP